MALAFQLELRTGDQSAEQLTGVISWVAVGFDAERSDRTWFDLDMDIETASERLAQRIYELDA